MKLGFEWGVWLFQWKVSIVEPNIPSWIIVSLIAGDIAAKYSNLRISEDKNEILSFDDGHDDQEDSGINLSLVRKVLTIRPHNFKAMKKTLNQIWVLSKGVLFRSIENGLFVVQFAYLKNKSKVLVGRPWTFIQNLVLYNEIDGRAQPSNTTLTHTFQWTAGPRRGWEQ